MSFLPRDFHERPLPPLFRKAVLDGRRYIPRVFGVLARPAVFDDRGRACYLPRGFARREVWLLRLRSLLVR